MSAVRFKCPWCGQQFEGDQGLSGQETECRKCGKAFTLEAVQVASGRKVFPISWYSGVFAKYVKFRGRAMRKECWWALFFHSIVSVVLWCVDYFVLNGHWMFNNWLLRFYTVASFLPMSAMQVRRLHDTNKSGWWVFLQLVPVVQIAYVVWLATDGDKGANRFGSDPKED